MRQAQWRCSSHECSGSRGLWTSRAAAFQLASILPPLWPGPPAAAPSDSNDSVEYLDPAAGKWRSIGDARPAGAYRFDVHGRKEYRWFVQNGWHRADLPTAVFLS